MNESFQELTDSQWQVMAKIVDDHRKRWHSLPTIVNAIFWLNDTGLQWRELNRLKGAPPWQSVYYHFRQFKRRGSWEQLLASLVVSERKRQQLYPTDKQHNISKHTLRDFHISRATVYRYLAWQEEK